MWLWLLVMTFNAFACDEKAIICETLCKADGDEIGVLIKGECVCGNKRDLGKYVYKIAVKGSSFQDKRKYYYDQ